MRSCSCTSPIRSSNPRTEHWCLRCSGKILDTVRDQEWEQRVLDEATELSERVFARRAPFFARAVRARLTWGAEHYGERNHLKHDCYDESGQEPPDGVAWLFLGLQADRPELREEDFTELERLAVEYTAHLAAAAEVLSHLRRKREDFLTD